MSDDNKCPAPEKENGHTRLKSEGNTDSCELNDDERTPMNNMENGGFDTPNNETAFNSQFENGELEKIEREYNPIVLDDKPTSKRSSSARINKRKKRIKESIEAKRERKAWRTLAIITGTFVACWTPFFLLSLYRPICGCKIPPVLEYVTSWLGYKRLIKTFNYINFRYLNSALNPAIYSIFNREFRMAFKRIIKRMCFMNDF